MEDIRDDVNSKSNIRLLRLSETQSTPADRAAHQRRKYLKAVAYTEHRVSRTRLVIRILSFILSGALVAVLSHALSVYYGSKNKVVMDVRLDSELRVWPRDMKMRPTLVLLAAASLATFLSGILCLASFTKAVRKITSFGNIATAMVSIIGFALWVAAAIYYKVDDLNEKARYDMLSFTCARRHDDTIDKAIGNLGSLCLQMRYAWIAALVIAVLELAAILTIFWGVWKSRSSTSYSKIGAEVHKPQ
ncbi:hypothetical protein BGZ60DRAFT_429559 [Tricladium varicosporioides]|nr:hypothetical protein BGZ60DRAFT_429559 [Hymenoscyphus varicosporioides]